MSSWCIPLERDTPACARHLGLSAYPPIQPIGSRRVPSPRHLSAEIKYLFTFLVAISLVACLIYLNCHSKHPARNTLRIVVHIIRHCPLLTCPLEKGAPIIPTLWWPRLKTLRAERIRLALRMIATIRRREALTGPAEEMTTSCHRAAPQERLSTGAPALHPSSIIGYGLLTRGKGKAVRRSAGMGVDVGEWRHRPVNTSRRIEVSGSLPAAAARWRSRCLRRPWSRLSLRIRQRRPWRS